MKLKKNVLHAVPLVLIFGIIGTYIAANLPVSKEKPASAEGASLAMKIEGDLNYEITPEVGGTYAEKTLGITVNTNNPYGYSLMMTTKGATEAKVAGQENGIKTVDKEYLKTEMPINSWGYNVGGDKLLPIPDEDKVVTLAQKNTAVENSKTDVTFGTKVAPSLKSGDYSATLEFIAIADGPCVGFYCISKMQEMTPAICDATPTPKAEAIAVTFRYTGKTDKIPRTILEDTRDGKKYLVSKYADGKCWMSQNLDLRLDPAKKLTNADTDLNSISEWTPDAKTQTLPYEVYRKNVEEGKWEFESNFDPDDSDKSFAPEEKMYLKDGKYLSKTPSKNDGTSDWEKIGAYYGNNAAKAGFNKRDAILHPDRGSDQMLWNDMVTTTDSICPKGWRLPARINENQNDFFGMIKSHYGEKTVYPGLFGKKFGFGRSDVVYGGGEKSSFWNSEAEVNTHYDIYNPYSTVIYDSKIEYGYGDGLASIKCVAR